MSSHKPRKKRHADNALSFGSSKLTVIKTTSTGQKAPAFPLVAFLWPARGTNSPWIIISLILMVVFLFRLATGLWGYSGFQSPPMHGDFEAQRHWMEVTTQLPISQWYFHDLEWWGLDYPPLTAYHSWLCGKLGSLFDRSWFALRTSRGLDDDQLKVYMRATVLASEYITYIPPAVVFVRRYARLQSVNAWESSIALVAVLMQPATILIDHGHFQYNTVMLGFLLANMSSLLSNSFLWSCVFFVASLGFKQMALFYAPAVFCYLLGSCVFPRLNMLRFLGIATVTILSFVVLFTPLILGAWFDTYRGVTTSAGDAPPPPLFNSLPSWLRDGKAWYGPPILQLAQSIHRIFPFARGLFEDKVANLWCAIHSSGIHKLTRYSSATVQRAALLATSATILPPSLVVLFRPRRELLPWAYAASAWGFFLCSYQVHEKNVLLPLLPMTLLLAGQDGLASTTRAWVGWANVLGVWTMFPLLKRDQLRVPYFVLSGLWAWLMGLPPTSLNLYGGQGADWVSTIIHLGGYAAMLGWHVVEATVPPPKDKPDLWIVANVVVGAGGFGACYLWCLWNLVSRSGLISKSRDTAKKTQ